MHIFEKVVVKSEKCISKILLKSTREKLVIQKKKKVFLKLYGKQNLSRDFRQISHLIFSNLSKLINFWFFLMTSRRIEVYQFAQIH